MHQRAGEGHIDKPKKGRGHVHVDTFMKAGGGHKDESKEVGEGLCTRRHIQEGWGAHTDTPKRFGGGHIDVPKKTDYGI